jgi:non-specific serine/threonine protein kinase/serine/threonine-protein kinase
VTRDEWLQIKQIAADAWDQPEAARAAFVATACAGNDALRREVESLLKSSTDAADLFETPAMALPGAADAIEEATEISPVLTGSRVGPYRIMHELGHGGMGAVFLAERADGEFDQQVAIKFVGSRLASSVMIRRFREERRILAVLEHPNIARLLDGGTTPDGMPYVVMEYVPGAPIAEFCDTRRLNLRARLGLFRDVCGAVHYAHQRLVIHRDIKAGNILVTPEGTAKLLDFGIATLIEPGQTGEARARTIVRALTPESASPEQIRGEPISIGADVYALGVLLYRLLTGQSPYRKSATTDAALIQAICEEPPRTPSDAERAGDAGVPPAERIDRDLDLMVLKALRKEPERRYSSAEQFSEDVSRYLEGRPVLAAPDSPTYRVGKFLRRNVISVTAAAAALVAVLAGAGVAVYQARVARAERARAEQRLGDVRRLANSFLFEFQDAIEQLPGALNARQLVVKRASEYLDRLSRESEGDVTLQRELATSYHRLGDILGGGGVSNLGDLKGAEANYLNALAMWERLGAVPSPTLEDLDNLARIRVDLSRFFIVIGDLERSEANAAAAVALYESPRGAGVGGDHHLGNLATTYHQLGFVQARRAKYADSLASLEKAMAAASQQLTRMPNDTRELARIARIQTDYAEQLLYARRARESLDAVHEVQERLATLMAADPVSTRYKQTQSYVYNKEAEALSALGDKRGAVRAFTDALTTAEAMRAAEPADQGAQIAVLLAHYSLGAGLVDAGDRAQGIVQYREALREGEAIRKVSPGNDYVVNQIAGLKLDLGQSLLVTDSHNAEGCRAVDEGLKMQADLRQRKRLSDESGHHTERFEAMLAKCK